MPKNRKKITCNLNLDENFAITYSGKAISQSKVPNSTIFEDMDVRLVSNDAARWNEGNILEIKAFYKVDFGEISYERHIAIFKNQLERTTSTQNFQQVNPNLVTLFLSQIASLPSAVQVCRTVSPR